MNLKERIITTHLEHPDWGATLIAHKLGCTDAYVRAAAKRYMLNLPRSAYGAVPSHGAQYCRSRRLQMQVAQ